MGTNGGSMAMELGCIPFFFGNGGLIGYFFSRLLGKYFKVLENILNFIVK
jgi:hypothetical protein